MQAKKKTFYNSTDILSLNVLAFAAVFVSKELNILILPQRIYTQTVVSYSFLKVGNLALFHNTFPRESSFP